MFAKIGYTVASLHRYKGGQGCQRDVIAPIPLLPAGFQEPAEWYNADDAIPRDQPLDDIIGKQAVAVVSWQERRRVGMAGDNGALI